MTTRSLLLTLCCVLLIAFGQLLFKSAALQWRVDGFSWTSVQSFGSPRMVVALAVYAVATVLWVYVLRTAPLSSAYLVMSLAFVIVPVMSHFTLDEPLTVNTLLGGGLIVLGIAIASR